MQTSGYFLNYNNNNYYFLNYNNDNNYYKVLALKDRSKHFTVTDDTVNA